MHGAPDFTRSAQARSAPLGMRITMMIAREVAMTTTMTMTSLVVCHSQQLCPVS